MYGNTKKKLVELQVLFLAIDKNALKYASNRWASWYTESDWIHCEFYFPHSRESCTVDARNPVYFMKDKNYSGRRWDRLVLKITPKQYNRIYKFCRSIEGEQFDKWSIWFFWCPTDCFSYKPNSWTCSRMVSTGLINAGVIDIKFDPYKMHPHSVRRVLMKSQFYVKHIKQTDIDREHMEKGMRIIDEKLKEDTRSFYYFKQDEQQMAEMIKDEWRIEEDKKADSDIEKAEVYSLSGTNLTESKF